MSFYDILQLALRNLRQAKLRFFLTTMGVIVGVSVIVTMVSFGLGLQQNMLSRFRLAKSSPTAAATRLERCATDGI